MKPFCFLLALAVGVGGATRLPAADPVWSSEDPNLRVIPEDRFGSSPPDRTYPTLRERILGRMPRGWEPHPAALPIGAISGGQLLAYQWEETDASEAGSSVRGESSDAPSTESKAAANFQGKNVRWYLADLDEARIRPLLEVMPHEGTVLDSLRVDGRTESHATHRWRWDRGGFWFSYFPIVQGVTLWHGAQVLRIPLDTQHPKPLPAGGVPAPLDGLTEAELDGLRKDAQTHDIRLMQIPTRASRFGGFSPVYRIPGASFLLLGPMPFLEMMPGEASA